MPIYIKEYTPENDFCVKCKLAKNTPTPFIEGRGNINSKVLILTDAPTKNDEILNLAYGGDYGKSIERDIVNAGFRSYYLSYMVKCFPDGKKLQTARKCCYPFTIALIREMKPKVIIAMGRDVLEHLTKVSLDSDVARLKKFYHPELNAIIVPTYSPRIFLNSKTDPLCKINFETDLRFAYQVLTEDLPIPMPTTPTSVKDPVEMERYLNKLLTVDKFAFDIETEKLYNEETSEILRETEEHTDKEIEPSEKTEGEVIQEAIEKVSEELDKEAEGSSDSDESEDAIEEPVIETSIDDITTIPSNARSKKKMENNHSPRHDKITDISFCWEPGKGVHFNWDLLMMYHKDLVKKVMDCPAKKVGHNGKYDVEFLECTGFPVRNYSSDTMIGFHRLTMSWEGGKAAGLYRLKTMDWFLTTAGGYNEVLEEFGGIASIQNKKNKPKKTKKTKKSKKSEPEVFVAEQMTAEQVIALELQKYLEDCSNYVLDIKKSVMKDLGLEPIEYYSAMDSDVTLRIDNRLEPEIEKFCSSYFHSIDMPVNEVFKDMELVGVRFDIPHMLNIYKSNLKKAIESKNKFFEYCGQEFNMGSTQQLQEVLFKKLEITPNKKFKTKTGNSTDENALNFYVVEHPDLKYILDYRGYLKQNSVYLCGFHDCIDKMTGRAYPSFFQIATATARISAITPALMTMPKDNTMRNMVIPREGWKFVTADLSQAELRMMAQMSGDENMIAAFKSGFDFHAYTACSALLHIPVQDFKGTDEYKGDKDKGIAPHPLYKEHKSARNSAKAINFGIIFMIGAKKLSEQIGTSVEEAQGFINAWFKQYPRVYEWIERTKNNATRLGYTETLYGRRRYLPQIKSPDHFIHEAAVRQSVNSPIQSSANDITFMALIKMNRFIKARGLQSRIILVIHDEIIVESPPEENDIIAAKLVEFMTKDVPRMDKVPLVADAAILDKWEK